MRKSGIITPGAVVALTMLIFGASLLVGARKFAAPATIMHVVTVQWTPEATPEQKQQVLDGVKTMAGEIAGIKNVWIKSTRVQPSDFDAAFAIEFEDKAAADRYVDHPAHKAWKKLYDPIHKESRSQQITN